MIEHPDKIKLLFFIFDLGNGGAEKVLVNLVNNLDPLKYDITIRTIFSGGVNVSRLNKNIKYSSFFKNRPISGITRIFRLFPPSFLYNLFIKGKYDIEIAFLQHHPTRIIAGSNKNSKKIAWVHTLPIRRQYLINSYKNESEFIKCYSNYDKVAFVSREIQNFFIRNYELETEMGIVHNVNEYDKINTLSRETIEDISINHEFINLISVGKLEAVKGFDRLIQCLHTLSQKGIMNWNLYILGEGSQKELLENLIQDLNLNTKITLLGFKDNPYKYISKMDMYICSSISEGYSTAATEAISLGIPILTTECSGMQEIIEDSYAGLIVPNSQKGLEEGLETILMSSKTFKDLKRNAVKRSQYFSTKSAIKEFEDFIFN